MVVGGPLKRGGWLLTSLAAERDQTPYMANPTPMKANAVEDFQLAGRVHHPPAGDQTSLGNGYCAPPP